LYNTPTREIGARKTESIYGADFWNVCHGPNSLSLQTVVVRALPLDWRSTAAIQGQGPLDQIT